MPVWPRFYFKFLTIHLSSSTYLVLVNLGDRSFLSWLVKHFNETGVIEQLYPHMHQISKSLCNNQPVRLGTWDKRLKESQIQTGVMRCH